MYYVPVLNFAGGLTEALYIRAAHEFDAHVRALVLRPSLKLENLGLAQHLSETFVTARQIIETIP